MINRREWIKRGMMRAGAAGSVLLLGKVSAALGAGDAAAVRQAIDDAVTPVIAQYGLPGVTVGVTVDGARTFAAYGVTGKGTGQKTTRDTLFELGSISKTFTATLAALAEIEGKLSLSDTVGMHMPELTGHPIGDVRLVDLATHTAGGFALQLPAGVNSDAQLMDFYRTWKPKYPAGTMRTYANPSIALLGLVTARAMGAPFQTLAEQRLFPALGLQRTFIAVPKAEMPTYAWGTNGQGKRVRVGMDPIMTEVYGVKSNAVDMVAFLEANMGLGNLPDPIARAVAATHTGYYRAGPFIQDLIWEQYVLPAQRDDMVAGNTSALVLKPLPAQAIEPPMPPRADVILNKTGSTGGFGAYVFCVPAKKFGMVILANKGWPNGARTKAAWPVMERVAG
jgi:beta-lactamase class C